MTPLSVIITIAAYFAILFTVSYIAGRKVTPTRMTRMVLLSGTSVSTPAGDGITLNVICIGCST